MAQGHTYSFIKVGRVSCITTSYFVYPKCVFIPHHESSRYCNIHLLPILRKKTHQVQTRVKENSLLIKVALSGAPITNADRITLLFVLSYKWKKVTTASIFHSHPFLPPRNTPIAYNIFIHSPKRRAKTQAPTNRIAKEREKKWQKSLISPIQLLSNTLDRPTQKRP